MTSGANDELEERTTRAGNRAKPRHAVEPTTEPHVAAHVAPSLHVVATPASATTTPASPSPRLSPPRTTKRLSSAREAQARASLAGVRVFATGGLGGVHRGASTTFDESADLPVLAQVPITVVSAGVKSILDIPATLERLETLSVTVVGYRTDEFPSFWLTTSGEPLDWSVPDGAAVADLDVADQRGGGGQRRHRLCDQPVRGDLLVRDHGAEPDRISTVLHLAHTADVVQRDDPVRPHEPEVHGRHEALSPGEDAAVAAMPVEEGERFLDRDRCVIVESGRLHVRPRGWRLIHSARARRPL